jgi:hypothetical protein
MLQNVGQSYMNIPKFPTGGMRKMQKNSEKNEVVSKAFFRLWGRGTG